MAFSHHPVQYSCRPLGRAGALAASLALAAGIAAGPAATAAFAQAQPQVSIQVQTQAKQIWPPVYEGQWHWYEPASNLSAPEVTAIFMSLAQEGPLFRAPAYPNALFTVRKLKAETKSKVAGVKVDGDWRSTVNAKLKGRSGVFVPLDTMTAALLWYETTLDQYKWLVRLHPAPTHSFQFGSEQSARRFIDAVESARRARPQRSWWLTFGMMTQDLTPDMAEDAGRSRVECVFVGMVAINGPADLGGIQFLDVITEFNGRPVLNQPGFEAMVRGVPAGASVPVTVLRRVKAPEGVKPSYTWERKTLTIVAK